MAHSFPSLFTHGPTVPHELWQRLCLLVNVSPLSLVIQFQEGVVTERRLISRKCPNSRPKVLPFFQGQPCTSLNFTARLCIIPPPLYIKAVIAHSKEDHHACHCNSCRERGREDVVVFRPECQVSRTEVAHGYIRWKHGWPHVGYIVLRDTGQLLPPQFCFPYTRLKEGRKRRRTGDQWIPPLRNMTGWNFANQWPRGIRFWTA